MSESDKKPRILIVEDQPSISKPLQFLLRKESFDVNVAENTQEANDALETFAPHVILLDIMLPRDQSDAGTIRKNAGIEICRNVKTNEKTKNIPVIMLTARGSEKDQRECQEAGADEYITKPFRTSEMLDAIKKHLGRTES